MTITLGQNRSHSVPTNPGWTPLATFQMLVQWIFLVLVLCWYGFLITPKRRQGLYLVHKRCIHCQLGNYICYLLPFTFEPEKSFDWKYPAQICDLQEMLVSSSPSLEMKNPTKNGNFKTTPTRWLQLYQGRADCSKDTSKIKHYWLKFTTLVDLIWIPPSCHGWQIPISWGNWNRSQRTTVWGTSHDEFFAKLGCPNRCQLWWRVIGVPFRNMNKLYIYSRLFTLQSTNIA